MKSKAPLVMMEQMVMILVFALAAALCMRAFVLSSSLSEEAERRDIAVLLCENAAESCKGMQKLGGGAETEPYTVYYDAGAFAPRRTRPTGCRWSRWRWKNPWPRHWPKRWCAPLTRPLAKSSTTWSLPGSGR